MRMKTRRRFGCYTSASVSTWKVGWTRRTRCLSCRATWPASERRTRRRSASWCAPAPSRRGLPFQPPWSPLLRSPALRTKRHRPHAPPLPPSRPVACYALLRWYLAWQAQENERRAQENEQERKRRLGAEQQLKQESGSMLKMPSQQHPSLNSMPSVRAPARLPRLLN